MQKEYDIAIVGAGPAGLMAAHEISANLGKNASIGLFDRGQTIEKRRCPIVIYDRLGCNACDPCGIAEGVMGAGLKSDGKLHLHPHVMEVYRMGLIDEAETKALLSYMESLFEKWGLRGPVYPLVPEQAVELSEHVASLNLGDKFELKVKQRTRHVGSDRLPDLVANMMADIENQGNFSLHVRSELLEYDTDGNGFRLKFKKGTQIEEYRAQKLLIALGRRGSRQVQEMIDRFQIPYSYRPVEIGGRVEVSAETMDGITDVIYNPCFRQKGPNGQATFTFCTNPHGYLTIESLLPGIVGVNGESKDKDKSAYTNFAVLTELPIPPGSNPNDTLIDLLQQDFKGNIPLAQTTADFIAQTVADQTHPPASTLGHLQYANVGSIMPQPVSQEIRNFLQRIERVCPGIIGHHSLFVAPEAKIRGMRVVPTDKGLQTSVDGLYLIGDSSGLSGNITAAAMTGVLAARDIANAFTSSDNKTTEVQ